MKKRYLPAMCLLFLLVGAGAGCGKKEEAVVFVEEAPEEDTAAPEEEFLDEQNTKAASEKTAGWAEPGSVLGEEQMSLYLGEEERKLTLRRTQGSFGYSLAFDPEVYMLEIGEEKDAVRGVEGTGNDQAAGQVLMTISENLDYALEELADELVWNCQEECLVEELTIGEEEYPAIWISYTTEEEGQLRQVDIYLVGFETHVFEIEMECPEQELDTRGADQQIILSTLRFDSMAEG